MESVMPPGDPMCQLVVIDNRNREEAIVTCPANRSQKDFLSLFFRLFARVAINCRGCDSAKGRNPGGAQSPRVLMINKIPEPRKKSVIWKKRIDEKVCRVESRREVGSGAERKSLWEDW